MEGNSFILLSRSLLHSQVFASDKMLKIWIWCLCKANHKKSFVPLKIGKGVTTVEVKRGQFIFGRGKAEEELFYDGSTIWKIVQKFQTLDMIIIESNKQFSIITICNYDLYQSASNYEVTTKEQPKNKQRASKGQPKNSQATGNEQPSNTYNNVNNEKNDNNENNEKNDNNEVLEPDGPAPENEATVIKMEIDFSENEKKAPPPFRLTPPDKKGGRVGPLPRY